MINLPVLRELHIEGYGLFPGTESEPGVHTDFAPGLKVILGANGLGKTTLVTILYRMLTGPSDIATLDSPGDLGNRRLEARPLSRWTRSTFAERVRDGAAEAHATLNFHLGATRIAVSRGLRTLEMLSLQVDGEQIEVSDATFERLVQDHAGVSSFGDWILALRYLVFYFEDRRALLWDPSAQRQLLRLLFLPPTEAAEMTHKERAILELDSAVRNTQYVLGRQEKSIARDEGALKAAKDVRQQLKSLQALQSDEKTSLDDLNDQLVSATAAREVARLNALTADQAYDSAIRNLERLQLREIEAAFPDATEVGKYIIGQILADEKCLTCGSTVPTFAHEIQERIHRRQCPVCGSPRDEGDRDDSPAKRGHSDVLSQVESLETQVKASAASRAEVEAEFDDLLNRISILNATTSKRSADIDDLLRRLPPAEQKVHQQRSELAAARALLEEDQRTLQDLRQQFRVFVTGVNRKIAQQREIIKAVFDQYAKGFLVEDCSLSWSLQKSRLGVSGELIESAAFEMDMTGSDFETARRRTGPDQVSESQREFIDLSFRMALIDIASKAGGTLVIDAPESSLDAVFATRAAAVLIRFCQSNSSNRLVVTSNLVDGDMIPELLRRSAIQSDQDPHILDLLKIATPTAATRQLHGEYVAVRTKLFERARAGHA